MNLCASSLCRYLFNLSGLACTISPFNYKLPSAYISDKDKRVALVLGYKYVHSRGAKNSSTKMFKDKRRIANKRVSIEQRLPTILGERMWGKSWVPFLLSLFLFIWYSFCGSSRKCGLFSTLIKSNIPRYNMQAKGQGVSVLWSKIEGPTIKCPMNPEWFLRLMWHFPIKHCRWLYFEHWGKVRCPIQCVYISLEWIGYNNLTVYWCKQSIGAGKSIHKHTKISRIFLTSHLTSQKKEKSKFMRDTNHKHQTDYLYLYFLLKYFL